MGLAGGRPLLCTVLHTNVSCELRQRSKRWTSPWPVSQAPAKSVQLAVLLLCCTGSPLGLGKANCTRDQAGFSAQSFQPPAWLIAADASLGWQLKQSAAGWHMVNPVRVLWQRSVSPSRWHAPKDTAMRLLPHVLPSETCLKPDKELSMLQAPAQPGTVTRSALSLVARQLPALRPALFWST